MNATTFLDIKLAAIDTTYNLTENDRFLVGVTSGPPGAIQNVNISIGKAEYYNNGTNQYDEYGNPIPGNLFYFDYRYDDAYRECGSGISTCYELKRELKFMLDYILDVYDNVEVYSMNIEYTNPIYNRSINLSKVNREPHFLVRNSSCLSFIDSDIFTFSEYMQRSRHTAMEALIKSDIKKIEISLIIKMPKDVEEFIDSFLEKDTIKGEIKSKIKKWFSKFM